MRGDIVQAARWLGGAMVLSCCILVAGLRWLRQDAPPLPPPETHAPADGPSPIEAMAAEEGQKLLAPITSWIDAPVYAADPEKRVKELLCKSDELRVIELEWERIWMKDEKTPAVSPERLHAPRSE